MKWSAEAPSNIALIKYMGKTDASSNVPSNASLSYTLGGLRTRVELESSAQDQWQELSEWPVKLSEKSKERFLKHFQFLKKTFEVDGSFTVRSGNNFPSDCGLASSASSFAALTLAVFEMAKDQSSNKAMIESLSLEDLSALSRQGSGSSCRSLFSPWALWKSEGAESIKFPYDLLLHDVLILEEEKKAVSSSEAHKRVTSSALFVGRVERAETRLKDLAAALNLKQWANAFEITWAEMWDMHALFETSNPSFGYMTGASVDALHAVKDFWQEQGDGPLVTMDAGPNVHLLFRPDQKAFRDELGKRLANYGRVLRTDSL